MSQKTLHIVFSLSISFCFNCTPCMGQNKAIGKTNTLSEDEKELVNRVFASRLLEIAAEYKDYDRVDQTIRWAPTRCRAPRRDPPNLGSLSESKSTTTHGKKLYYLYAKKASEYEQTIWRLSKQKKENVRAPLGQVLVKESWSPVPAGPLKKAKGNEPNSRNKSKDPKPFAMLGNKKVVAGKKVGLFIMFKNTQDTPGTDRGWVYGTVSADGKKVTSVGKVASCIQCHKSAPFDRQIGIPDLNRDK